jgi:anti-anti-sigma factor
VSAQARFSRPVPACGQTPFETSPNAKVIGSTGAETTITWHTEEPPTGPGAAVVVVTVSGDLDRDSTLPMETALLTAIDGNSQVSCDLSGVTFFGAAGVGALARAHEYARANSTSFTIRGAQGMTWKILRFAGLGGVLQQAD